MSEALRNLVETRTKERDQARQMIKMLLTTLRQRSIVLGHRYKGPIYVNARKVADGDEKPQGKRCLNCGGAGIIPEQQSLF